MEKHIVIRNEEEKDFRRVEEVIRKAFWNLYVPGCDEHYLAHVMRSHPDFLPELDFVIEAGGRVIGNIMYTKAALVDGAGGETGILTFGPVCIEPGFQRMGYGSMLMSHSFEKAAALGHTAIVIFGNPGNYVGLGFKSCRRYDICLADGSYPSAMLAMELRPGALEGGGRRVYRQSPVYEVDAGLSRRFDDGLEPMERKYRPCQEEFYIHSHSVIRDDPGE